LVRLGRRCRWRVGLPQLVEVDQRQSGGSLASDLMEAVRPPVDRVVVDLLGERALVRRDVIETREGVCRVGASLARELAGTGTDPPPPSGQRCGEDGSNVPAKGVEPAARMTPTVFGSGASRRAAAGSP